MSSSSNPQSNGLIEAAATAIYDTDEDIIDENISSSPQRKAWNESKFPRQGWSELDEVTREAYRRRARAAFAAVAYLRDRENGAIVIGARRFNLVEVP